MVAAGVGGLEDCVDVFLEGGGGEHLGYEACD